MKVTHNTLPVNFLSAVLINFIIIILCVIFGANILFAVSLLIWLNLLLFAVRDLGQRSMLFAFLISFFVFLLGRELVQQFFKYKPDYFEANVNDHFYFCIIISLISLLLGFLLCNINQKKSKPNNIMSGTQAEQTVDPTIKSISLVLFYITWLFAVVSKVVIAKFVAAYGYNEYYTDFSEYLFGNTLLYVISKLEGVMPVALSIFSATLPSKKEYQLPAVFYGLYLIVSLSTGQRSVFTLGILFLMVYFLYRHKRNPEEKWITKRMVKIALISIPLLAVFFTILSSIRVRATAESVTLQSGILDFLYDQGVTANILKRAYMNSAQIPKQIYSLEFIHSGILARIFNIPVYHGNTYEHAMYGGSFTHALGYVILGASYLAGRGTGSCYIAELYYDLGYFGVFIGNLIYGYIIAHINRPITKSNVFKMSVRYYIITQILWAPRASLTGFLSNLFAPFTVLAFLFVFGFARFISVRFRRRENT